MVMPEQDNVMYYYIDGRFYSYEFIKVVVFYSSQYHLNNLFYLNIVWTTIALYAVKMNYDHYIVKDNKYRIDGLYVL